MGEAHRGSGDQTRRDRVTVGSLRVKKAATDWGRRDREMGIEGPVSTPGPGLPESVSVPPAVTDGFGTALFIRHSRFY